MGRYPLCPELPSATTESPCWPKVSVDLCGREIQCRIKAFENKSTNMKHLRAAADVPPEI